MRTRRTSTMLLMALLSFAAVRCATPRHQIETCEGCMSRCERKLQRCTRGCYTPAHMWSDQKVLICVEKCNQKKAKCGQLCTNFKEYTTDSSAGIRLSIKVSDSILNFARIWASRPLPAAHNFPKKTPITKATNSQTSSMIIEFIASPPLFCCGRRCNEHA